MVLVVPLLMKSLSTNVTYKRLVSGMDSYVSVQCGRSIECLVANVTFMGFFLGVYDLVTAQCTGLSEALSTNFALKWPCARVDWHMAGQIVMRIEDFAANFASKCLWNAISSLSSDSNCV